MKSTNANANDITNLYKSSGRVVQKGIVGYGHCHTTKAKVIPSIAYSVSVFSDPIDVIDTVILHYYKSNCYHHAEEGVCLELLIIVISVMLLHWLQQKCMYPNVLILLTLAEFIHDCIKFISY